MVIRSCLRQDTRGDRRTIIESKAVNLKASYVDTPLGSMIIVADEEMLYLLKFIDRHKIEQTTEQLRTQTKLSIIAGKTDPILQMEAELKNYFSCQFTEFKTPLLLMGTPFQKRVWEEVKKIPAGETRSYAEIAAAIQQPTAFRAVALANRANLCTIVVPCHRVINSNGDLGGYRGGVQKKEWLLKHENRVKT